MKKIAAMIGMVFLAQAALAADGAVKLIEPKPITAGHKVVPIFPPGHLALKALADADKEEIFTVQNNRVAKVNNIHVPTLELYLAPAEKANGMSVILSPGGGNKDLWVGPEGVDVANW